MLRTCGKAVGRRQGIVVGFTLQVHQLQEALGDGVFDLLLLVLFRLLFSCRVPIRIGA